MNVVHFVILCCDICPFPVVTTRVHGNVEKDSTSLNSWKATYIGRLVRLKRKRFYKRSKTIITKTIGTHRLHTRNYKNVLYCQ